MKTLSKSAKKREEKEKEIEKKTVLVFKERAESPNEFQLRIDNITKHVYGICYPQWIKNYINSVDRIYMRIKKENSKLTYELLFSGFKKKFSINFEKSTADAGNECSSDELGEQRKPKVVELNKSNCSKLLADIFVEFDKLGIKYKI